VADIFFEDLTAGYRTRVGEYALTAEEIVEFASRWDPYPFHTDPRAAQGSVFGGLTASSCHRFAITTLLSEVLINQAGVPILTQRVSLLVARRSASSTLAP
jgi:acyl dehydratase